MHINYITFCIFLKPPYVQKTFFSKTKNDNNVKPKMHGLYETWIYGYMLFKQDFVYKKIGNNHQLR